MSTRSGKIYKMEQEIPAVSSQSQIKKLNSFVTKKTITQGLLDVALLTANVSQLKYVVSIGALGPNAHPFYYPMIVLLSISIILQVSTGLCLIFLGKTTVTERGADMLNDAVTIQVFLIAVINIMISSFGIEESVQRSRRLDDLRQTEPEYLLSLSSRSREKGNTTNKTGGGSFSGPMVFEVMTEVEPYAGTNQTKGLNVNRYATKKTIAQGMLDIALLTANASQLKYVLQAGQKHPFYTLMITLISISISLQVTVGVCMLVLGSLNMNKPKNQRMADILNNIVTIKIFLISVINVVISSFGIEHVTEQEARYKLRDEQSISAKLIDNNNNNNTNMGGSGKVSFNEGKV